MTLDPRLLDLVGPINYSPEELQRRYDVERDKRLRREGIDQYVEVTAEFSHYVDDPYTPRVERSPVTDHVDVAVVGAGFAGLLAGSRLRQSGLGRIRLVDKGGDVGGTWYWNRYPGCCCDVVSYLYLPLLEELEYVPTRLYATADEIYAHCVRIAEAYDLYQDSLFHTAATNITWDEAAGHWIFETDRGDRFTAQFAVMASGTMSRPKLPGIPGINEFQGYMFHTSRWDYGYTGGNASGSLTNLTDKSVGVVGTGATAIQCVPHLAEWAKQLYVFQRTPSSIDVRNDRDFHESEMAGWERGWQRRRQENFDILVEGGYQEKDLTGDAFTDLSRRFTGTIREASRILGRRLTTEEKTRLQKLADFNKMNEIRARVDVVVEDPETAEKLKPWYRQMCKRPGFSDNYLPAFNRPNVKVVDTDGKGVERLTENAVVVAGVEYPVDCLIFATGFEMGTAYTRRTQVRIAGEGGERLSDKWNEGPRTLWGMQTHGFPNCFFVDFIQSAFVGCVTHSLDEQASHISWVVKTTLERGAGIVDATLEAEEGWVAEIIRTSGPRMAFFKECTPGYYNDEGKPDENPWGFQARNYGRGSGRYFAMLKEWRDGATLEGLELRPAPGADREPANRVGAPSREPSVAP